MGENSTYHEHQRACILDCIRSDSLVILQGFALRDLLENTAHLERGKPRLPVLRMFWVSTGNPCSLILSFKSRMVWDGSASTWNQRERFLNRCRPRYEPELTTKTSFPR
jgi:hypothetical protein